MTASLSANPAGLARPPRARRSRVSTPVRVISPGPALLVLDGQEAEELVRDDEVQLQLATARVKVFENPERPFLRTLQAKLGWQGTERRSM